MSSENCFCLSKATSQIGAKAEIFDNLYFVFRLGRVSAFSTGLLNSGEPSYAVVGSAGASPSHGRVLRTGGGGSRRPEPGNQRSRSRLDFGCG